VTDANLVLGRLPAATRLAGGLTLDRAAAIRAVEMLAGPLGRSVPDTALGIVAVANQHMAQALRLISLERGHDPRSFTLVCFGGAGGLHVCALASELAIPRVIVPAHAGVFSALGMLVADPGRQLSRTLNLRLDDAGSSDIAGGLADLAAAGRAELRSDGHADADVTVFEAVDLRYRGQSYTLTLPWRDCTTTLAAFHAEHRARYGHAFELPVELVNVRVELRVRRAPLELRRRSPSPPQGASSTSSDVVGLGEVPVCTRAGLAADRETAGPLVIVDDVATTFVDRGWRVGLDAWGNLDLRREAAS
jgi:N-methylhydantoinase A